MSPSFVLAFLFVLPLAMARGSDSGSGSHSGARRVGVVKEAVLRVVDRVMKKPAVTIKFDKPSPFRRVVDDDDDYDYHMCDANEIDYDDDHFPAAHGQKSPSHQKPLIGGVYKPKPIRFGGSDSDRAPTVQIKPIALPGIQIPKIEIKPVSEKATIKVDLVRPLPLAPVVKQASGSRKVAIKISEPTVRLTAPVFVKQASVSDKVAIKVAAPVPAPVARPAAPAPAAPAPRPVVKQVSGSDKVAIKVAAPAPAAPAARPVLKQGSSARKATVKVATPVLTRARIAM